MKILSKLSYSYKEITTLLNTLLVSHGITDKAIFFLLNYDSHITLEEIKGVKYSIIPIHVEGIQVGYLLKTTYADDGTQETKLYNDIESLVIELLNIMVDFRAFEENYDFCAFRYDYLKNKEFKTLDGLVKDYTLMKETFDKSF